MSCEALGLTGSLHITRKIHHFKASVSPFCSQQLVASLVATPFKGSWTGNMEITAALQWLHVGPQTLPGPLPISTFALVLGVGWVRGFTLSFWAFAHLKSLILFLGKSVSPSIRTENPVQGFQPWCCCWAREDRIASI